MSTVRERILSREQLDFAGGADAAANLRDLRRINRFTGAQAKLIGELKKRFTQDEAFRFLDVGAASGDMGRAVKRAFPNAVVVSVDLVWRNLDGAAENRVQADAFRLPFRERSFDVAHCSLFLHHFSDEAAEELIGKLCQFSRRFVLMQDLERSRVSYYFLPLSRWIFGWHWLTVADGMASVAAGWKRNEMIRILRRLKLGENSAVEWHFPSFRYFIAIKIAL